MPRLNDQLPFVIVSCTYIESSFTSVCRGNVKRLPPRVRSIGSSVAHGVPGTAMSVVASKQGAPAASVVDGKQRWIDDAEAVVFVQEGVLVGDARLDVVNALHIRNSPSERPRWSACDSATIVSELIGPRSANGLLLG